MKWEKQGLIFCPDGKLGWDQYGFMTPCAHVLGGGTTIRLWGGIRDADGISRIAWIDVNADNPKEIVDMYREPALDIGAPGCFDDNGMILGDILEAEGNLRLYYVGFQHVEKAKFFAFSGVAISDDGGKHFERHSAVPIMDRTPTGRFGRCVHNVIKDESGYKIYYTVINDWKCIEGIKYPVYDIWRTESKDGIHVSAEDNCLCVTTSPDEYRIGRPKVYRTDTGYEMFYTRDFVSKDYVVGYARSSDGIHWQRDDANSRGLLPKSGNGWDSEMACYPVMLSCKGKTYLFYNGNGMGRTGVGFAVAVDSDGVSAQSAT